MIIREVVRTLIGGALRSVPEPIAGSLDVGTMHSPHGGSRSSSLRPWSWWEAIFCSPIRRLACGSGLRWRTRRSPRLRDFDQRDLWRDFAFGAALAGLAGALIVPVFSLFADLGIRFLIQGFVAVMVGGVGRSPDRLPARA